MARGTRNPAQAASFEPEQPNRSPQRDLSSTFRQPVQGQQESRKHEKNFQRRSQELILRVTTLEGQPRPQSEVAADELPLPSPTPVPIPSKGILALPAEINLATRHVHTQLNRLIISRLPFCLPPHANSPQVYAVGLHYFAAIYFTFEDLWLEVSSESVADADAELRLFLKNLLPPSLMRSQRLRRDLHFLQSMHGGSEMPRWGQGIEDFIAQMRETVKQKPHVLVAYAWVMYMAIFSGGRWIRAQLQSAGDQFWHCDKASLLSGTPGMHLFCFDGERDGEDIKADFKVRLEEAEGIFTPAQRQEVVQEATNIFRFCITLVADLDSRAEMWAQERSQGIVSQQAPPSYFARFRFFRLSLAGWAVIVSFLSWYVYYKALF